VIPHGGTIRVVVTYTYDGKSTGKVVIAGEIPDAPGEQCRPSPPSRDCEKGEKKEAHFSLKVDVPATWPDGRSTVSVTAMLLENEKIIRRLPLPVAAYVEKKKKP
jgi:hypothetical protein